VTTGHVTLLSLFYVVGYCCHVLCLMVMLKWVLFCTVSYQKKIESCRFLGVLGQKSYDSQQASTKTSWTVVWEVKSCGYRPYMYNACVGLPADLRTYTHIPI